MGFGFNLLFAFILLPGTVVLLLIWGVTRKRAFGHAVGCIWIPVFVLAFIGMVLRWAFEKKNLSKNDFHGRYISLTAAILPGSKPTGNTIVFGSRLRTTIRYTFM